MEATNYYPHQTWGHVPVPLALRNRRRAGEGFKVSLGHKRSRVKNKTKKGVCVGGLVSKMLPV